MPWGTLGSVTRHTAPNPVLVCEVLSPSTEDHDRGEELAHYKRTVSLREVLLVAHDDRRTDVWRRLDERRDEVTLRSGERIRLESLGCSVEVDEIHRDPLAG
ncbi:MAG: Uma2 family endonuclease [Deltaproteobacteria bacterium]|nr:Uma2 family endonuclease [Deltaproteobacteria bacterium]